MSDQEQGVSIRFIRSGDRADGMRQDVSGYLIGGGPADSFGERIQQVANAMDRWPDWKLDTYSLSERNKRRNAGEILPIPSETEEDSLP
jgi:hypothetical protein